MALEKSNLLINIEVNTKKSAASIGEVEKSVKKLDKTSGKAAKKIDGFGKNMENMAKIFSGSVSNLDKTTKTFEKTSKNTSKEIIKLGKNIDKMSVLFSDSIKKLDESLTKVAESSKKVGQASKKSSEDLNFFKRSLKEISKSTVVLNQALELLGKVTRTVGAIYRSTAGSFSTFEDALKQVQKTTNISAEEARNLGLQFRNMATEIPVSAAALAEMAGIAGQLGVRGSADLKKFVTVISQVTSATDLSAESASLSFARILDLTNTSIKEIDKFASSVVALGNNFKTGEAAIVAMANQIARSTALYDVSSASVAAFATTLKTMGVNAELGGTAVGKTFAALNNLTQEGGKQLEFFTEKIGLTGAEFTKVFKEDSATAFKLFIKSLSTLPKLQVGAALESIGLSGQGVAKIIAPLSKKFEELERAMKISNEAFDSGTAAAREAGIAWNALSADTKTMTNSFNNLGISIGELVAPAIRGLFNGITALLKPMDDFARSLKDIDFSGAIKESKLFISILVGTGGLLFAIRSVQIEMAAFALFGSSTSAISVITGRVVLLTKGFWAASVAAGAFVAKIGLIALASAAIFALVAVVELLVKNIDKLEEVFQLLSDIITRAAAVVVLEFKKMSKAALEMADELLPFLNVAAEDFKKFDDAIEDSRLTIKFLDKSIEEAKKGLDTGFSGKIIEQWNKLVSGSKEKIESLNNSIKDQVKNNEDLNDVLKKRIPLLGAIGSRLANISRLSDLGDFSKSGKAAIAIFGSEFDKAFLKASESAKAFNKFASELNKKSVIRTKEKLAEMLALEKAAASDLEALGITKLNIEQKINSSLLGTIKESIVLEGNAAKLAAITGNEKITSLQKQLKEMEKIVTVTGEISEHNIELLFQSKSALDLTKKMVAENIRLANIQDNVTAFESQIDQLNTMVDLQSKLVKLSGEDSSLAEKLSNLERQTNIELKNLDVLSLEMELQGNLTKEIEQQILLLKEKIGLEATKTGRGIIDDQNVDASLIADRASAAIEFVGSEEVISTFKEAAKMMDQTALQVSGDVFAVVDAIDNGFSNSAQTLIDSAMRVSDIISKGISVGGIGEIALEIGGSIFNAGVALADGLGEAAGRAVSTMVNAVEGAWQAGSKIFRKLFKTDGPLNQFFFTIGKGLKDMASSFFSNFPAIMGALNVVKGAVQDIGKGIVAFASLDLAGIGKAMGQMASTFIDAGISLFSPSFWEGANSIVETFLNLPKDLSNVMRELIGNLDKFVESFASSIKELLSNFPVFIQAIANMIPEIVTAIVDSVGMIIEALPNLMARIIDGLISGFQVLLDRVPELVEKFFDALPLVINKIIQAVPGVIISILEALPSIVESFVAGIVGSAAEIAVMFIETIINRGPAIFSAIMKAIPKIAIALVKGIISGLAKGIKALFSGSRLPSPRLIDDDEIGKVMKGQIKDAKKASKGFGEDLFKIVDLGKIRRTNLLGTAGGGAGAANGDGGGGDNGQERSKGIFAWMKEKWLLLWGWVEDFGIWLKEKWTLLWGWVEDFGIWIKEKWTLLWGWVEDFGTWLSERWKVLMSVFSEAGTALSDMLKTIRDAFIDLLFSFGTLISHIVTMFQELPGKILAGWNNFIVAIQDVPAKLLKGIDDFLSELSGFFSSLAETLLAIPKDIAKNINNAFIGLREKLGLTNIGDKFTAIFSNIEEKITAPFMNALSGISEKLTAAISAPFHGIISKIVDGIKSTIKGIIPNASSLKSLFAQGGQIPAFAQGGALTSIKGYEGGGSIIQGARAELSGADDTIIGAQQGEFMLKKASASSLGLGNLNFMNQTGKLPTTSGTTTNKISTSVAEGAIVVQGTGMDPMDIAEVIFSELKRRSMDGEFMLAKSGIRETT